MKPRKKRLVRKERWRRRKMIALKKNREASARCLHIPKYKAIVTGTKSADEREIGTREHRDIRQRQNRQRKSRQC